MRHISTAVVCIVISLATAAFGKPQGGKISATLFDGRGNKEVIAEAKRTPREPAPAPQPVVQQPQATTTTLTDGKGGAVFTREQKGDTTTVKDGKGRIVSATTKNADGTTTTRDGTGRVRTKVVQQPAGK